MVRRNGVFLVFLVVFLVFAVSSSMGDVSAAKKVIDKDSFKVDSKTNMTFQTTYDGKQVDVSIKYKGLMVGGNSHITIKKAGYNKLKVSKTYVTATPGSSNDKIIKTKLNPFEYYWQKYVRKIIKMQI